MLNIAGHHVFLRLNKQTGAVQVDLSLNLTAAWTVIFGPSGSGKTTILRAICGLLPKADMRCTVGPDELAGNHKDMATHGRRIAYAPQGAILFPHLSVRENVAFVMRVRGVNPGGLVEEALALFELQPFAGRMPHELSGGERQRVNLARAFAVPDARLMLLDEPFTGLGPAQRDGLLLRMHEAMATRGVPVISVTHDVEEAFLLGADVVRLEAGKVIAQGSASDVLAAEREQMLRSLA